MIEISQEAVELPKGVESWWFCPDCLDIFPVKEEVGHAHECVQIMRVSDLPAIQAQVLAGVKRALKLRISEHEAIATRDRGNPGPLGMEHSLRAGTLRDFLADLATLNPTEGEGQ